MPSLLGILTRCKCTNKVKVNGSEHIQSANSSHESVVTAMPVKMHIKQMESLRIGEGLIINKISWYSDTSSTNGVHDLRGYKSRYPSLLNKKIKREKKINPKAIINKNNRAEI